MTNEKQIGLGLPWHCGGHRLVAGTVSVRPRTFSVGGKILTIAAHSDQGFSRFWRCDIKLDSLGTGIGFSIGAAVKVQLNLALRIVAADPTHKRVNRARIGLREFQHPTLCLGGAGLGRFWRSARFGRKQRGFQSRVARAFYG